jgi:hypothetical protein
MLSTWSWGLEQTQRFSVTTSEQNTVATATLIRSSALRRKLSLEKDVPSFEATAKELQAKDLLPQYHEFYDSDHSEKNNTSDIWVGLPYECTPAGGNVPASRVPRKMQQVESLVRPCIALIRQCLHMKADIGDQSPIVVVEFCAGSGFVALPLAAMFPTVHFVLVDAKAKSIEIGRRRVEGANLRNVDVVEGWIEEYCEPFDIGIALHACGAASDVTMEKCYESNAGFVVCPCCVGKINHDTQQPRSAAIKSAISSDSSDVVRSVTVSDGDVSRMKRTVAGHEAKKSLGHTSWTRLLGAADFGHSDISFFIDKDDNGQEACNTRNREKARANKQRRVCKSIVEWDRCLLALERNYDANLLLMTPRTASPKNDIIVAWPITWRKGALLAASLRRVETGLEDHLLGLPLRPREVTDR